MKTVIDISYWSLASGFLLLILPFFVLWYYKTQLLKDSIIAIVRMTVQLLLVGVYLEYFFEVNNTLLNISWVFLMLLVSAFTVIKRSNLSISQFFVPVFVAGILSIAIIDIYFLGVVIKLENLFDAQYFIPITGMLLGNTIRTTIIGLNAYYGKIDKEKNYYYWHLGNGATKNEALLPFKKEALRKAFNPIIASTAIVGLIALPGMMTGQILGGSSPNVAIKYQIMLMITIFSSSVISVILTILISDRFVFDKFGNKLF